MGYSLAKAQSREGGAGRRIWNPRRAPPGFGGEAKVTKGLPSQAECSLAEEVVKDPSGSWSRRKERLKPTGKPWG